MLRGPKWDKWPKVGQGWAISGTGYRTKLGQWTKWDQMFGSLVRPSDPRLNKAGPILGQDIEKNIGHCC